MSSLNNQTHQKKNKTEEIIKEIVVFQQVLYKLGCDEIDNEIVLVDVLNDFGFTGTYGKPFTHMGYRQMMKRADPEMLRDFITSLKHEPIAHLLPH